MTCLNQSNVFRQTNTSLRNWRFRMSNAQMCGAVLLVERANERRSREEIRTKMRVLRASSQLFLSLAKQTASYEG